MLAWLQAAATDGSMSSEQSCEGDDGSAYLQHFAKESSASLALLSGNSSSSLRSCSAMSLNNGACVGSSGSGVCNSCEPSNPTTIPTSGGFPTMERMVCSNPVGASGTTCKITNGETMPLTGNWYKFGDLDDQLVCRGGSQVCNNRWNIQDVAAVCCSAEGADQSVCYDLWYVLSTTNTRVHDICCDGLQTCYNFDFLNVNSLSCRGQDTCYNGDADIASNLYCDGQSLVNNAEAKNACYQFGIIFGQLQASNHCITCKGDETCRSSDWKFPNGGNVQMSCSNLPAAGNLNCYDLNLFFDADACIYLDCNDGLSSPQGNPCSQLAVLAKKSPAANVDCTCVGNCGGLRTTSPDTAYKVVNCSTDGTGSTCGITCGIDDTACCKGDPTKAANGGHPRCGTGFCTTSTSSTTTTTSESGQDPSSGTTTSTTTTTTTSTAQGAGDPHIDTFDGQHYLLLKQGSFSFWRFSGSDAEIFSAKNQALLKKLPVDFKIYAHYSGHTSYTKGLLLVDSSGATAPKRVLELTSEDCTWRTKTKDTEWSAVEKPQLLSLPDADGDEMTAFRMTEPLHGQKMYVELLMKKPDGAFKKIGNLYVRCKPGYHINTKIAMTSKEDIGLVQGQVGAHGHTAAGEDHKASFLQGTRRVRSDSEFVTSEKWTDLGGSAAAESYLSEVDEEGPAIFLKDCTGQERIEAKAMCKKYLGEPSTRSEDLHSFENRFDNCVFDVCNGGGEVAAELAAEIFHAE